METHSSIIAWRIPWTEEPGRLQSEGLQRVSYHWSNLASTWCKEGSQVHSFSYGYPVVPATFVEKTFLSPFHGLSTLVENQLAINIRLVYQFWNLFCWSVCLFLCQYHSHDCCSVVQSCPTLCNPMDCSMPGFSFLHCLLEFAPTHVHDYCSFIVSVKLVRVEFSNFVLCFKGCFGYSEFIWILAKILPIFLFFIIPLLLTLGVVFSFFPGSRDRNPGYWFELFLLL